MNKVCEDLKVKYNNKKSISRDELYQFLGKYYENISTSSFLWMVYDLKEMGLITIGSSEMYILNFSKPKIYFKVKQADITLVQLLKKYNSKIIDNKYFNLDPFISVWDTRIVNKYIKHTISKNSIIVEVDKYRIDDVFNYIKKNFSKKYYVTKTRQLDSDHIIYESNIIYIKQLVKRAPINKKITEKEYFVTVPKIEKILVDVVVDNEIFNFYDESTLKELYRNINDKYNVNLVTLLYYAKNRGVKQQMLQFLRESLGVNLK
ncbi:MAG: hypothetical protein JEZ05_00740 [Tenericutes bacterium]|nr:hypothetical protein [Mycoplasmatota bacterium]